eukprot:TRINITY_DN9233_c0_g1_i14.p1 TRINITY_DN9233_c0_g1~~TRINITY_DN9233_c0_g1_i14.p1  ORF type:complete len:949 (+),score=267.21 TRINITY_DN9233_c0_g1_i14:2-2848(+)
MEAEVAAFSTGNEGGAADLDDMLTPDPLSPGASDRLLLDLVEDSTTIPDPAPEVPPALATNPEQPAAPELTADAPAEDLADLLQPEPAPAEGVLAESLPPAAPEANKPSPLAATPDKSEAGKKPIISAVPKSGHDPLVGLPPARAPYLKLSQIPVVTKQFGSAEEEAAVGVPSTLVANSTFVAVGTTAGLVLVFDQSYHTLIQTLSLEEASPGQASEAGGPVFSVALYSGTEASLVSSKSKDLVLVGHMMGGVALWDLTDFTLMAVCQAHPQPVMMSGILSTGDSFGSVSRDGLVQHTSFSKKLMGKGLSVKSTVVMPPALEPVLALSVCPERFNLMAVSTSKQTVVYCVDGSTVRPVYRHKLPEGGASAGTGVYHGWYVQTTGVRKERGIKDRIREKLGEVESDGVQPVFAISCGRCLDVVQIVPSDSTRNSFDFIHSLNLAIKMEITSIGWISDRIILVLDSQSRLRVLDPYAGKEVETMDLSAIQIHTQQQLFATKNNNSHSYHNSVCTHGSLVYLLGNKTAHFCQVLSWHERMAGLEEAGNLLGAISLCLQCWQGKAAAVVGLPRNQEDAQAILSEQVHGLLENCFREMAALHGFQNTQTANTAVREAAGLVISCCLCMEQADYLYQHWLPRFVAVAHSRSFLEVLEQFILEKRVPFLTVGVVGSFYETYRDARKIARVEDILQSVPPSKLTSYAVISICKNEKFFKTLTHTYNIALGDYATPLQILLEATFPKQNETPIEESSRHKYTRLALLYLNQVLAGKELVAGDMISEGDLTGIRSQIYEILFVPPSPCPDNTPQVLSFEHLLRFDAKGFFRALTFNQKKVLLLWAGPIAAACSALKIKKLDLSNISLSDDDARGIAEIAKRVQSLEVLVLNNNHIGNSGADFLFKAIDHNPQLYQVELDNNVVGSATYSQIQTKLEQRANAKLMDLPAEDAVETSASL